MTASLYAHDGAVLHGLRQSEWILGSGLSRSVCFQLFRLARITPELRRPPAGGKPVAYLLPEHLEVLEPLAERYRQGASLRQLEEDWPAPSDTIRHGAEPSGIVPVDPGSSAIVPDAAAPSWIVPVVEAVRSLQPIAQEADPLKLARRLREAADLGVPLSQSEVACLLGLSISTVADWSDDREIRPGFTLRRHYDGRRVWWTVRRDCAGESLTVQDRVEPKQVRPIGFADVLAAAAQGQEVTLMVRGPVLPVIC